MEPVAVIKRKVRDTDYTSCFFCQTHTPVKDLRTASTDGKIRAKTVADQRRKFGDTHWLDVLDRLETLSQEDFELLEVKWHKNCYASFTAENKIARLRKQHQASEEGSAACASHTTDISPAKRRSSQTTINWKLCMFCQREDNHKLHMIATLEKSSQIIEYSRADPVMRTRLAGVADLIAAEACYHLACLVKFERRAKQFSAVCTPSEMAARDIPMETLCKSLIIGLAQGHVYDMADVWQRYEELCSDMDSGIALKYQSRRATFYEEVQRRIGAKCSYVRPLTGGTLLIYPGDKSDFIISKSLTKSSQQAMFSSDSESTADEDDGGLAIPHSNIFQEMVHVALKVKQDLQDTPGHGDTWHGIDNEHVAEVVPGSLYLFLRLLFGGTDVVNEELENSDEDDVRQTICSIAQDIVYAVSKKRKLTPKHIGLGLALHQATRSEALVDLFHAAGHIIGIDTVRRMDTTIAQHILDKFERNGNVYIPENIAYGRLIHCSCDNIDVLEATLSGKNSFHCTQMMVWQRGPAPQREDSECTKMGRSRAIKVNALQEFQKIDQANLPSGKRPSPLFSAENKIDVNEWFISHGERQKSRFKDLAWLVSRITDDTQDLAVPAWSAFNEAISAVNPPVTTAGMLPILQAPADDNNTMTTVINRFVSITKHLGQQHTIITADQPLYSRGKELVWANSQYKDVIFLMGGLHICFHFLKAIGQHMESAGLDDLWAESGVYAPNTTETMLEGKAYYRAVRGHLLTYEALWHIKWLMFESWLEKIGRKDEADVKVAVGKVVQHFQEREKAQAEVLCTAVEGLINTLQTGAVQGLLESFEKEHSSNPNFTLWSTYMKMVEILMDFIRAERDGNWTLHLESFAAMLPWLTVYDHTNYARWGPVYLADMKGLQKSAPEVYSEFTAGNFVVKRSNRRFNQVPADQATEWINRTCKMQNGIIGITQNDQARDRFCLTWSERSHILQDTRQLFHIEDDEELTAFTRSDSQPSRVRRDAGDVKLLKSQLELLDVFRLKTQSPEGADNGVDEENDPSTLPLVSLATKDTAPAEVVVDLQTAEDRGQKSVVLNVKQRLIEKSVQFHDPLKKHNSKTFGDLYKAKVITKQKEQKTIKADRKLLQRLLNSVSAGRTVDMTAVLKHELCPVPLSLATAGGEMNSTQKSDLLNILSDGLIIPAELPRTDLRTCVLVDGHALIQAIGKPPGCQTFGEYATVFMQSVTRHFRDNTNRVDVVFDRYIGTASIKTATRFKRVGKKKAIRKLIEGPHVPLPQRWGNFIALDDNKADLARFLSEVMMTKGREFPDHWELVTGGGYSTAEDAKSTKRTELSLNANHEEADTRLILHALEAVRQGSQRIVIICRDTDVLVLLVHFLSQKAVETWMVSGTSKNRKCYPVHEISNRLDQSVRDNLIPFHALTGCDSASSFSGHGKKSCWKIFHKEPLLVSGIGQDGPLEDIEKFVCKLYGNASLSNVDSARAYLFGKAKKGLEMLPPSKDALQLHAARANYQAKIWLQADIEQMEIISPSETDAWEMTPSGLQIVWTKLPAVPDSCMELVTCGCTKKCSTARCMCFKRNLKCTPACGCDAVDCCNPAE